MGAEIGVGESNCRREANPFFNTIGKEMQWSGFRGLDLIEKGPAGQPAENFGPRHKYQR